MKNYFVIFLSLVMLLPINGFARIGVANNNTSDLNKTTNLKYYSSKPYQSEGAGYNGADLKNLKSNCIVTFSPNGHGNVAEELNTLIDKLSKAGGGKITIPKGDYIMREVYLKSNIQLIIASGVTIKMDNAKKGKQMIFIIGSEPGAALVENVRIVGLGSPENRPKLELVKYINTSYRAINLGNAKNILIENLTIIDNLTKSAAIAFNPVKIDENSANIPENVTVANVSLTGGSIGYGLVQTNVGKNVLLKNLYCQGGMTCRIESHTGKSYDVGVDNIVIQNVVSKNGKAAVLLQPHSVENGRILVDGAIADGSTWALFIREGFVNNESKRKQKGTFASSSTFKNIALISSNNTATLSYKNFKYVPEALKSFYKNPDFNPVKNDTNNDTKDGKLEAESAVVGASVAVIFTDATYPLNLPDEKDISLTGETAHRLKVLRPTKKETQNLK